MNGIKFSGFWSPKAKLKVLGEIRTSSGLSFTRFDVTVFGALLRIISWPKYIKARTKIMTRIRVDNPPIIDLCVPFPLISREQNRSEYIYFKFHLLNSIFDRN